MKFLALSDTHGKHWKLIPDNTDILLTHGPPFGVLDFIAGSNVGCEQLLKRVKKIKPRVHLLGHIHEANGSLDAEDTRFINASILDDHYQIKYRPFSFEL
ncbi:MAG: metallophosphoesterase [Pedobacter sp.]|jgi:Icc-related predicted phosphoesterase|nr:metallophosphoesterase [Pedobacter sp.]